MSTEPTTSNDTIFGDKIKNLENKIKGANEVYRTGSAIMSDAEYDTLIEELEALDPDNDLLNQVGYISADDSRKQPLPVPMASMNKIKTIEDYKKWLKSKNINSATMMVLTPKFDGLSFCVDERNNDAWSRGDGVLGQYSPEHYKLINNRYDKNGASYDFHAIGEVIMSRKTFENGKFLKDDGTPFKNPRNLVAGKINDKNANELLKHCDYIRYGLFSNKEEYQTNKSTQITLLNELNAIKVQFKTMTAGSITEELLNELFKEWNKEYEIDGIIIEVDSYEFREELGRETSSNNPCYARAFKGAFEQTAKVQVLNMNWQMGKQGYAAPVCEVEPALLDGATVSNVFADNARFVEDMGIGVGAIIEIKRSGMVIPRIIKVVKPATGLILPKNCPSCNSTLSWNDSKVQLCCINDDCQAQRLQKIIAFFEIIGVDNMGEGVCEQLYDSGYDTVAKILNMSKKDMEALDRFGERKSEIVYGNIHAALKDIPLSKLQHASGCFKNLGSKKLELLTWADENTSVDSIKKVEGFSEISAKSYLAGIKKFNQFAEGLPVTIKKAADKPQLLSDKCKNWSVVFTGFTNAELEKFIVENGGAIGSGVSKKTTHLVIKMKGSGSSKEQKAESLGVPIYDVIEFDAIIKKLQ